MQNYDDLDIEGRNPSHYSEEEREKDEFERRRLMRTSVTAEDGILRPVYSRTDDGLDVWCHVCNIGLFGAHKLQSHNSSSRHKIKLGETPYPVSLWSKKDTTKSFGHGNIVQHDFAPGEPAPPGMEDQMKRITTIQVSLDRHKSSPLVGLEYLLEIVDNDSPEPSYTCVLCDKRGDPRTVMAHITSYNHRMTYLHRHFPTISRAMTDLERTPNYKRGVNEISVIVAKKIEEKFGRLQPQLVEKGQYEKNKTQYMRNCVEDFHFRETPELTFMEVCDKRWVTHFEEKLAEVTSESKKDFAAIEDKYEDKPKKEESKLDKAFPKKIEPDTTKTEMKIRILTKEKLNRKSEKEERKLRPSDDTKSLSSLSSISSSPSPTRSRSRSRSRSRNRRQSSRDRARHRSAKQRQQRSRTRSRSTELLRERDKWDKFREQIRRAEETLDRSLKFHEKNPEKHPSYPDEWKKFWNRRYKELQAEGKDPSKHDFKPEWIDFWNKRMREIHNEQLASRKEEIRKRLELPEDKPPEPAATKRWPSQSRKVEKEDSAKLSPKRSRVHAESDDDVEYVGTKTIKPERPERPERIERIERSERLERPERPERFDYHERHPREDIREREYYVYPRTRPPTYRSYYSSSRGGMPRPPPRHYPYPMKEDSPPPIPPEESNLKEDLEIVGLLRLLTALEGQLGSLGPKVVSLLSRALAAEKAKPNSAEELLEDEEVNVLFETVKEKLKGQLFAGMIEKMAIAPTKSAIQNIAQLLHKAAEDKRKKEEEEEKRKKQAEMTRSLAAFSTRQIAATTTTTYTRTIEVPVVKSEPVSVPGIGSVDKVAIAQQIAAALVAQGRDNVSQDELETLINAVVGMAEASKHSDKPITAASFVKSLTEGNNGQANNNLVQKPPSPPRQLVPSIAPQKITAAPATVTLSSSSSSSLPSPPAAPEILPPKISPRESTPPPPKKIIDPIEAHATRMENLTDNDLKDLLQNFKDLGTDEQHGLINFLKKLEASNPARVEKLRAFVNLGGDNNTTSNNNQRRSETPTCISDNISTKSRQSVSPFSTRKGGHNPSDDEHTKWKPKLDMFADDDDNIDSYNDYSNDKNNKKFINNDKKKGRMELSDDDDDDYSFEDIYKAANKNVVDNEKAKNDRKSRSKSFSRSWSRSRSRSVSPLTKNNEKHQDDAMLNETKRLIDNIMDGLPNKYVVKSHINTIKDTTIGKRNIDVPPPGSTTIAMPSSAAYGTNPLQNYQQNQNHSMQTTQNTQQTAVTYPGALGQHQFANYQQQQQQQNSQTFNANSNYMNMGGINNGFGNYNNQGSYNQGQYMPHQQFTQPPPQMFTGNQYGLGQIPQGPPPGPPPSVGYPQQTQYPNYSQQQQRFY